MVFSLNGLRRAFSQLVAAKVAAIILVSLTALFAAATGIGIAHQEEWVNGGGNVSYDGVADAPVPGSIVMKDYLYNPFFKFLFGNATFIIDGMKYGRVHIVIDNFNSDAEVMSATLYCTHHSGPLARVVRVHRLLNNQYQIRGQHSDGEFSWDLPFMTKQAFAEDMDRIFANAADVSRWRGHDDKGREVQFNRALDSPTRFNLIHDGKPMHFYTAATTPRSEIAKLIDTDGKAVGNVVISQVEFGAFHITAFNFDHSPICVVTVRPCDLRTTWISTKALEAMNR